MAFLLRLSFWIFLWWYNWPLLILFSSSLSMRFFFVHPTWEQISPTVQNLRWFLRQTFFKASGTTCFFFMSYGEGQPSKTFNLSTDKSNKKKGGGELMAAVPRLVSLGIIPLMAFQIILLGEVYFCANRFGLCVIFLCAHALNSTLLRKSDPALITFSQRTTTIFCPERSCFANVDDKRPKMWSFPSIIINFSCIWLLIGLLLLFILLLFYYLFILLAKK